MKRTMLGILGAGCMILVVAGLQLEVSALRREDSSKQVELSRLAHMLKRADPDATDRNAARIDSHSSELLGLEAQLAGLVRSVSALRSQIDERTRLVARQATDAMGTSRALSKAVESTQRLFDEQTKRFVSRAKELEVLIARQGHRFDQLRDELRLDTEGMTLDMLIPTVQLSGEETVGSGTLIACIPGEKPDTFDTFVLTANHVVRNILADEPGLSTDGITITIYAPEGRMQVKSDVLLRHAQHDVALLKLRSTERIAHVAKLVNKHRVAKLDLWDRVYAVGCPLGNDPIPTGGFISSLESVVRGTKYWMINAPTYYGNSGGGIFDADSRELIAVFSKIYTHGSTRPVVIPHMGLAVPMTLVYPWLEKEGFGHLVPGGAETAVAAPAK